MAAWCEGVLRAGDSLAVLEKDSGVSWKEIVRKNGANPESRSSVDKWVVDGGGRINASGWAVFNPGQVILLPCGVRPKPLGSDVKGPVEASAAGSFLPWLIGGGVVAALLKSRKPKKKKKGRRR